MKETEKMKHKKSRLLQPLAALSDHRHPHSRPHLHTLSGERSLHGGDRKHKETQIFFVI